MKAAIAPAGSASGAEAYAIAQAMTTAQAAWRLGRLRPLRERWGSSGV